MACRHSRHRRTCPGRGLPFAVFLVAAGLAPAVPLPALAAGDPAEDAAAIVRAIDVAALEPARAVGLKGVRLAAGLASIQLDGTLLPATPIAGRSREMVFLGRGRVTLEPPDDIEAGQLELFTGSRRLAAEFKEAVLVVGSTPAATALLRKPAAPPDPALARRAEEVYQRWRKSHERKALHVESGMLVNAIGEPAYEGYFAASFLGTDLGDLLYQVDPESREQVTLGHFVPLDATEKEQHKLVRELARQRQKGRLIGVELEDLGQWDTWVSTPLRDREGRPAPGAEAFEPERYTLDVTLAEPDLRLVGRARIAVRPVLAGARAVTLRLAGDFDVSRVTGAAGEDLVFLRRGNALTVVLPPAATPVAAPAATSPIVLDVEYSGSTIQKDWSLYALQGTLAWYPHAGSIDRAPYDVTFHWSRKLDLVSAGRRVDGGETNGTRWERRRVDTPALGFTFEVGHFKIETARAGHVALQVAFDPDSSHLGGGGREEVVKTVVDALAYFEETFGPYPMDELNVVTVPRGFSQSVSGLVTLSDLQLVDLGMWNKFYGLADRREVIAHEVAHQWWGDLVGWQSYRDQWISEAMASYCARLWAKNRLDPHAQRGASPITVGWRQELAATTADGRPIEALGPVVLGERLFSSRAHQAFTAIVYGKGAVVLEMMARALGAKEFSRALREVVRASAGRTLSTEELIALLGQVTATDLSAFAGQFIYGTGMPEVFYSHRFEHGANGGWMVKGEARQESAYRPAFRVIRNDRGAYDLRRDGVERVAVAGSVLAVPVDIAVFDPALAKSSPGSSGPANATVRGTIVLRGESTSFAIPVEQEPKDFWLDRHDEVFGVFYDESRYPKRAAFAEGLHAASAGHAAEAEAFFTRALAAAEEPPLRDAPWGWIQQSRRLLNAQIELGRARLYVEQGRDQEARAALDRAGVLSEWKEYLLLESRLELRAGQADKAFRRLDREVLERHRIDSLEGLLLLAIAARATGHDEPFDKAARKARDRGADVSLLRSQ
jgi:Peptidase family M1 domain